MTTERQVRVVCLFHHEVIAGMDESYTAPLCKHCGLTMWSHPGTILATLRDPEAEALMTDGERYRNRVPEAIAILTSGSAYERMHVLAILRGDEDDVPTPTPETRDG